MAHQWGLKVWRDVSLKLFLIARPAASCDGKLEEISPLCLYDHVSCHILGQYVSSSRVT
jgi:hypothetical protein